MAAKAGVLTIVGVLCVVMAVLIFSQYRQCAAAEGATLTDDTTSPRLSELMADQRILERRVAALEEQLAATAADLNHCHVRTDDLHDVLKALIPVWPGRARLPMPNGPWDPWPIAGSNLDR